MLSLALGVGYSTVIDNLSRTRQRRRLYQRNMGNLSKKNDRTKCWTDKKRYPSLCITECFLVIFEHHWRLLLCLGKGKGSRSTRCVREAVNCPVSLKYTLWGWGWGQVEGIKIKRWSTSMEDLECQNTKFRFYRLNFWRQNDKKYESCAWRRQFEDSTQANWQREGTRTRIPVRQLLQFPRNDYFRNKKPKIPKRL